MDLQSQYNSLVQSLKLLAASYKEQKAVLPDYVEIQDEVVSMFGDAFLLLPQLIENDFLSRNAIAYIISAFNWMDLAMRSEETANVEAFRTHEFWQKVRWFATQSLLEMKEQNGEPDLSHISWIKGNE